MKKSIAFVLAFMMLALVGLSGCSGTTSTAASAAPASSSSAAPAASSAAPVPAKPTRSDLNLAIGTVSTLDPQASTLANDVLLYRQSYEGLVSIAPDGTPVPRVAESWEQSPDGLTYTFRIRKGIQFHNGEPVTAADCVFALERGQQQNILNAYVEDIVSISSPDADTVVIKIKAPNSAFLINISQVYIVSKKAVETLGDGFAAKINDAGTGPYKVAEYDPNVKIVLKKFADYYGSTGNIETATYNVINEAATREVAFESGELDFIEVPTSNWSAIESSGKYNTVLQETAKVCRLCMNTYTDNAVMKDKAIREAVMYAINKQAVIDVALNGLGVVANVFCNPKYIAGSSLDGVTIYEYNPDKAKQILKDAGYANGVDVGNFLIPNKNSMPEVAQIVQSMLAEVGIRTTIDQTDSSTASARSKTGDFGFYMNVSTMINHMSTMFRGFHSSGLATQCSKYNSPELDAYLVAGGAATTVAEMNAQYAKVNQYVADACIDATLYYLTIPFAWDKALNAKTNVDYYYINEWNWN